MIKNLLVVTILFLSGACGNKAQPEGEEAQIPLRYIKYYIRYMENGHELQIDAKFHNDTAAIAMPDGIFVGETNINAKKLPHEGWIHRSIGKSKTPDSIYIFQYKISKSKERQDTVEMPLFNDFLLETPVMSKKTGGLLTWKGKALKQSDGLVLIFEDAEGHSFTHTHRGITQGPKFEIRPDLIQTLSVGKGILRIVHKRESRNTNANQQIFKQSEYYRTPIIFEIVE